MIDEIFSEMKMTAENLALRDELMANAQARYEDSVAAGKSEEEVLATYEKYAIMLTYLVDWGFSAAVYTQLTDVEGEVNGLMTYDRKVVKLDIDRLNEINTMVINGLK